MQCQWHKSHMMPNGTVNGTVNGTIHFIGQDNQNEVQYDFLSHMMPLVLASKSCDVDNLIS